MHIYSLQFMAVHVCVTTEEEAVVPCLAVRSASDDHLLSHAGNASYSSTSSLHLDCEDIKNLTKSDEIDTKQHPVCNHDMPEKCISSCWSFGDDSRHGLVARDDVDEIERCLSVTEQLRMTKSKSTDNCCRHGDQPPSQSPVTRATCFYPTSW